MLCRNCQAKLPEGKVLCAECGCLNPYNIKGYSNTAAVQTALRNMIDEQCGNIADMRQFCAIMLDYLPDYRAEYRLLKKAVDEGFLETMIEASDKRLAFKGLRNRLVKGAGFGMYDAEFVLTCFGHMLGLNYVSPMFEDSESECSGEKDRKDDSDSDAAQLLGLKKTKTFGKFDAFRFALSGRVTVKEGYAEIEAYCFENYGRMKEISLPSTLCVIGEYAFSDCKGLESIDIPDSVRKLDKGVFNACLGLKRIILPSRLLSVGDNCFFCCASLKSMRIPDTVSSIGENAFAGCAELERLVIPKSVKFIDSNAFSYCGKLTVICTENSFVHKYCMQNRIKYRTLPMGMKLPYGDETEVAPDE